MTFVDYELNAEDFAGMQAMLEAMLANQESTPEYRSEAGALKSLYKAAAKQEISTADVKAANREEAIAIVHNLFANPADFTFVFAGDVNVDSITDLCNRYIGSIPAPRIAGVPYKLNPDFEPTVGAAETTETMAMETPQTYVNITLTGNMPYTAENRALASIASQILSNRLLKKVREEMGAVYSIGAGGYLQRVGDQNFFLTIPFPMKPELKDEVLPIIKDMVDDMGKNISDEEFNPIREYMVKTAVENLEKNAQWTNAITGASLNGVDTFNGQAEMLGKLTAADVKAFMQSVLSQGNYRVFVLDPEK